MFLSFFFLLLFSLFRSSFRERTHEPFVLPRVRPLIATDPVVIWWWEQGARALVRRVTRCPLVHARRVASPPSHERVLDRRPFTHNIVPSALRRTARVQFQPCPKGPNVPEGSNRVRRVQPCSKGLTELAIPRFSGYASAGFRGATAARFNIIISLRITWLAVSLPHARERSGPPTAVHLHRCSHHESGHVAVRCASAGRLHVRAHLPDDGQEFCRR